MAPTFRVIGTNVYTNNTWTAQGGIPTAVEANSIRRSFTRLEFTDGIEYSVKAE